MNLKFATYGLPDLLTETSDGQRSWYIDRALVLIVASDEGTNIGRDLVVEVCTLRRSFFRVSSANQRSTELIQYADVGA